MIYSREHGVVHAKGFIKQRILVPLSVAGAAGIHLVVELRIGDMELEWGYTNDRPILFMKLNELEGVLAAKDKIVVKLIPINGY